MVDRERIKCEQCLSYKLEQYKKIVSYYILNNISLHVTLVQWMDSLFNANNEVSVFENWIFDYKYKRALPLSIEYLKLICYFYEKRNSLHCLTQCFML